MEMRGLEWFWAFARFREGRKSVQGRGKENLKLIKTFRNVCFTTPTLVIRPNRFYDKR